MSARSVAVDTTRSYSPLPLGPRALGNHDTERQCDRHADEARSECVRTGADERLGRFALRPLIPIGTSVTEANRQIILRARCWCP